MSVMTELRPRGAGAGARGRSGGRAVFAREAHMLAPLAEAAAALCSGLSGDPQVFFEVPLAAGVPDMVVVTFDAAVMEARQVAGLGPVTDVSAVRTLVGLGAGATGVDDLAVAAGLSAGHLRRTVLPSLSDAGWVERVGGKDVVLLHPVRPVVSWAVAVEAKRSAWAQAVSQAHRMLPAADRVFVALDAARAGRAVGNAKHLASLGVGLATVEAEPAFGACQVAVVSSPMAGRPGLPRGHRAPKLAAKVLLGERVWELELAGRRHGPTQLVFGRDLSTGAGQS
ncbi:hypothetical protein GCM10009867_17080 [Pedococcus aerophilus]|uniref:Uncharacterized protein n=1 Tax=Pedococcus aerophilus TaxID=436356 RepID=A0ABP6H2S2_9MICO